MVQLEALNMGSLASKLHQWSTSCVMSELALSWPQCPGLGGGRLPWEPLCLLGQCMVAAGLWRCGSPSRVEVDKRHEFPWVPEHESQTSSACGIRFFLSPTSLLPECWKSPLCPLTGDIQTPLLSGLSLQIL